MSTIPLRQNVRWTPEEVTLALVLYLQTPYSKIDKHNPKIIQLAELMGRSAPSITLKLCNIASLDPYGGKGSANGSKNDRLIWDKYMGPQGKHDPYMLETLMDDALTILTSNYALTDNRPILDLFGCSDYSADETLVQVKVRCQQSLFRESVLAASDMHCLISGLSCPSILEAAHIIPWKDCQEHRLNPENGLALNPMLHRAFDANLIGIDEHRIIHVSDAMFHSLALGDETLEDAKHKERSLTPFFESIQHQPLLETKNFAPNPALLKERFNTYLQAQKNL